MMRYCALLSVLSVAGLSHGLHMGDYIDYPDIPTIPTPTEKEVSPTPAPYPQPPVHTGPLGHTLGILNCRIVVKSGKLDSSEVTYKRGGVPETVCQTVTERVCRNVMGVKVDTPYSTVCNPQVGYECIKAFRTVYKRQCHTIYSQSCDYGGYGYGNYRGIANCRKVPKRVCNNVPELEAYCSNISQQGCKQGDYGNSLSQLQCNYENVKKCKVVNRTVGNRKDVTGPVVQEGEFPSIVCEYKDGQNKY